jgi:hypothetical protein
MERLARDTPFPAAMQGTWTDVDDPGSELIVQGGEVSWLGQVVSYDYKFVTIEDGALAVSLKINDVNAENAFQRTNVTELVITPYGEFHAYNVKFACQLERRNGLC